MHEFLLGFDARQAPQPGAPTWTEERRWQFLLRLDVAAPCSIDRRVWASVFDLHADLRPAYTGIWEEVWEDLRGLEACVTQAAGGLGAFWIVAFALMRHVWSREQQAALEQFLGFLKAGDAQGAARIAARTGGICTPDTVAPNWSLLGYDVADLGLTSGLTNMGFLPGVDDVDALRLRWRPHINASHLFDDLSQAIEFKNFSNQRVPEHAPFFVYGLWLVRSEGERL
jgi:hypothetical protein